METVEAPPINETMLAWEVEIHSLHCIVFATTKAKAQWIATKSYWEAYPNNGTWPRAKAWRRECYDRSLLRYAPKQRAFSEDCVKDAPITHET